MDEKGIDYWTWWPPWLIVEIYRGDKAHLDLDALFASRTKLILVATNKITGQPEYMVPQYHTIFDIVRASGAVPLLHWSVALNGTQYIDGGGRTPFLFRRRLKTVLMRFSLYISTSRKRGTGWGRLF